MQPAPQATWNIYDDDFIRFQHPTDYFVARTTDTARKVWMTGLLNEATPGIPDIMGSLGITGYYDASEKRPLKDIYSQHDWGSTKFTTSIKPFSPRNAECLMVLTDAVPLGGCSDSHGKPKDPPFCIESRLDMRCYDKSKNYFIAGATLGRYEKGYPAPKSVSDNLTIIEGILQSLEFK